MMMGMQPTRMLLLCMLVFLGHTKCIHDVLCHNHTFSYYEQPEPSRRQLQTSTTGPIEIFIDQTYLAEIPPQYSPTLKLLL